MKCNWRLVPQGRHFPALAEPMTLPAGLFHTWDEAVQRHIPQHDTGNLEFTVIAPRPSGQLTNPTEPSPAGAARQLGQSHVITGLFEGLPFFGVLIDQPTIPLLLFNFRFRSHDFQSVGNSNVDY